MNDGSFNLATYAYCLTFRISEGIRQAGLLSDVSMHLSTPQMSGMNT